MKELNAPNTTRFIIVRNIGWKKIFGKFRIIIFPRYSSEYRTPIYPAEIKKYCFDNKLKFISWDSKLSTILDIYRNDKNNKNKEAKKLKSNLENLFKNLEKYSLREE